jgi:hypothetical protein
MSDEKWQEKPKEEKEEEAEAHTVRATVRADTVRSANDEPDSDEGDDVEAHLRRA